MSDNRSPVQLLKDAKQALDLLASEAGLFGRGAQLDILKAHALVKGVFEDEERDRKAFESWEASHGYKS